jgi:hypothetical protein
MALPSRTLDDVTNRVLAYFRTSFEGKALGTKRFLGRMGRSISLALWGAQKAVEDAARDTVPSPQMSGDVLAQWAFLTGLPDGVGGYGPLAAAAASGGLATLTGVQGTIYPDATTATADDGTVIQLSGAVTIAGSPPGYGSVQGRFIAVTAGLAGNLPIGTRCTWDSAPSGADSDFILTSALSGGSDTEAPSDLYKQRLQPRLQTPPRGGVSEDIRLWLGAVTGVRGVWVYPKRSGTGTVDVVVTLGGSGQGRAPSATVLADAQEALDENLVPGAEDGTVVEPYMPDNSGHIVKFSVEPALARFAFDWDDRATSYSVDLYTAGPPATLRLNTLAPATLKAAIDSYLLGAGLPPRLQVISTGSVINEPVACVAYSDGGGKTTLTLDSLPDGFVAPTAADEVFAYGPLVPTIAAGALALADSLGPSRASGFGDPVTPWVDKLTISGLTAVAEDAVDADGTELIAEVIPGGVTIDAVVADVQGTDGANGPELLYLEHVIVVRSP